MSERYDYLAGIAKSIEELNEDLEYAASKGYEPYMIEQQWEFWGKNRFCSSWLIISRRKADSEAA